MQQYELNGRTILLVAVPETVGRQFATLIPGKYGYSIAFSTLIKGSGNLAYFGPKKPLPDGEWRFVGSTKTISECQAAELVEEVEGWYYKNYCSDDPDCYCIRAINSFKQWLQSIGITHNCAILVKQ